MRGEIERERGNERKIEDHLRPFTQTNAYVTPWLGDSPSWIVDSISEASGQLAHPPLEDCKVYGSLNMKYGPVDGPRMRSSLYFVLLPFLPLKRFKLTFTFRFHKYRALFHSFLENYSILFSLVRLPPR